MVFLSCLMVILLTLYFFLHRPREFEDIDALHGIETQTLKQESGNLY